MICLIIFNILVHLFFDILKIVVFRIWVIFGGDTRAEPKEKPVTGNCVFFDDHLKEFSGLFRHRSIEWAVKKKAVELEVDAGTP